MQKKSMNYMEKEFNYIKDQFATYEISLALKELGFNEPCFGYYTNEDNLIFEFEVHNLRMNKPDMHGKYCAAILWQQVIDWLGITHKICIIQDLHPDMSCGYDPLEKHFQFNLVKITESGTKNALHPMDRGKDFNSYEEGREWIILKAIELCQKTS